MKKRIKPARRAKFLPPRILVLLLVFTGFCYQGHLAPVLAQKSPNEIRAGVLKDFPPQYCLDEKTGNPAGFAIDTMDEIARRAGLKIRYIVFDDWPLINRALQKGEIDVIPSMGVTKERTADMDFTSPLETFTINIFVRSTATDIQGIDDLRGRKVAVVISNAGISLIEAYGKAKPLVFQSLDEALLSLLSGNTDALVYPEPSVLLVARRSKFEGRIKTVGPPLLELKRAVAVGKGKPELLAVLSRGVGVFVATPEYREIYAKWYGAPEPYWNPTRIVVTAGAGLALMIILFAAWHFFSLTRLNRNLRNALERQKEAEEAMRRNRETVERLAEEMIIIAEIGRVVGSTLNIDEVYERVAAGVRKLIPFDSLIVNVYHAQQETLEVAYVSGLDIPGRRAGESHSLRGTIGEGVLRERKGAIVQSENPDDLVDKFPGLIVSVRAGMRSLICVPLISRDEVIGTLIMRSKQPDAYAEQDLRLAEKIGMQIAGAIANAQLFNDLSKAGASLRESEARFRTIFEVASVGIVQVDPLSGRILRCNETYSRITGYSPTELQAISFSELTHPEERRQDWEAFCRAVRGETPTYHTEKRYIRKDGTIIWVRLNAAFIRDSTGRPIGTVTICEEITERKRAEEERRILEERLKRAEKMEVLGTMAGGVAHDLNNVLGILSGYSELLLEEIPAGHRSRRHVEKILESTERGAAIIEDLLTLARRGVTTAEVINLTAVVSGFLKTPIFEKMRDFHPLVTFRAEYDPNLLNIKGSPVHLEKTVMNLVANAAESISGRGEVTIRTRSRHLDRAIRGYDEVREGDYAMLTVSDTGTGIPAEDLGKIFEPFYTKKKMGRSGTGLGLAIVWGTVKDHHGYIDVQTEVGQGSTFTLYFPVTREEPVAQQLKTPMEEYLGKGESVLVVDDIAEQRDVAARLLARLEYEVHAVSSGEEAVEYLRGNRADILVLDMIMEPGIDGLETYRRVLEVNPKQKAILVSGFSETERVREAQAMGAGAYVRKPYVMEKIGMAIRNELSR